jgi:hypothetical protein
VKKGDRKVKITDPLFKTTTSLFVLLPHLGQSDIRPVRIDKQQENRAYWKESRASEPIPSAIVCYMASTKKRKERMSMMRWYLMGKHT